MRKGNVPFVFSACVLASLALADCGADDNDVPSDGGGSAGDPTGDAGGISPEPDGGEPESGRGRRDGAGFADGSGGTRFMFDALPPRDTSDPGCPSTMPTGDDPCAMATTCAYPGGGCTCQREGHGDAGRTWHCQEFPQRDGGYAACADDTATGTGCEMQGRFCSIANQICVCFGTNAGDRKWACF